MHCPGFESAHVAECSSRSTLSSVANLSAALGLRPDARMARLRIPRCSGIPNAFQCLPGGLSGTLGDVGSPHPRMCPNVPPGLFPLPPQPGQPIASPPPAGRRPWVYDPPLLGGAPTPRGGKKVCYVGTRPSETCVRGRPERGLLCNP